MKKLRLLFSLFGLTLGIVGGLAAHHVAQSGIETQAEEWDKFYPRSGASGTVMYVNGSSTYFNTGQADLAIYCFNSESDNAWSDRVSYRVFGDFLRVMIPYQNGNAKTWSKFIVCRYDPAKDPSVDGFGGVYNQTADISFGSMLYGHNTINITGYDGEGKLTVGMYSHNSYYGIPGNTHMYLDLSGFPSWEEKGAKFAIWFAYPNSLNESRWSQANSLEGYHSSFCWKVQGQDNDHLYECIVPNIYSGDSANIWNMAIAVRFDPAATEPNWDYAWNRSQNLSFNSGNHNANMIRMSDWGKGEFDTDNIISAESRLEFYGRCFLNTVTCSGDGKSDATTNDMWNAVKWEYIEHLTLAEQGDIWLLDPTDKDTQIAQAMARYDYIVFKKGYAHEDFINRTESVGKTSYASQVFAFTNKQQNLLLITLILFMGVICVPVSLLLVRNAKKKER